MRMEIRNYNIGKYEIINGQGSVSDKILRIRFRLLGTPPDQAVKLIEVAPNQTIWEIKKDVMRAYRLNPILGINLIFKKKIIKDNITFNEIAINPVKDVISVMATQAGGGNKGEMNEDKFIEKLLRESFPTEEISEEEINNTINGMKQLAKQQGLSFSQLIFELSSSFHFLLERVDNSEDLLDIWNNILERLNRKNKNLTQENIKEELREINLGLDLNFNQNEKRGQKMEIKYIETEKIKISEDNVRKDLNFQNENSSLENLANSIKEKRLIHPIIVNKKDNGEFELIAGYRRLRACKEILGWKTIPAQIIEVKDDIDKTILSLMENVHRSNINPIDFAQALGKIYNEFNKDISTVIRKTGLSETTIRKYLKLLKLAPGVQDRISAIGSPTGTKTLGKIADDYSEEHHDKAITLLDGLDQETQIDLIRKSEGDISKLEILKEKKIFSRFTKNILKCRFGEIRYEIQGVIENLARISPLVKLFRITEIIKESIQHHIQKFIEVEEFPWSNFSKYYWKYAEKLSLGEIFHLLLSDFIENYRSYHDIDIKKEIFEDLLEMVFESEYRGYNGIFNALKLMNEEPRDFIENMLPMILNKLTNRNIYPKLRVQLFNTLAERSFRDYFDLFLPILIENNESLLEIQSAILKRLENESPRYSTLLGKAQNALISMENSNNSQIREITDKILIKMGKMCANAKCKAIINEEKNYDEIKFCSICKETYCEKCLSNGYSISNCNFCNTVVCQNHYDLIDIESRNLPLCESCLTEGKYSNRQIICKKCQEKIMPCSNEMCGKLVCKDHRKECRFCEEKIYCLDCAERLIVIPNCDCCYHLGAVCLDCDKNEKYYCKVCEEKGGHEYIMCDECIITCDDCGKKLCEEHSYSVPDWCKIYCKECLESWKDYTFQMEAYGR